MCAHSIVYVRESFIVWISIVVCFFFVFTTGNRLSQLSDLEAHFANE